MADSQPTMATYFMHNFRPDVRGDPAALAVIFDQEEPGRPFFFACDDPDQIGLIYTLKSGLAMTQHFYVKSHFTGEIVTVSYLDKLGVYSIEPDQGTIGHLIVSHYEDRHPALPHFRQSSDKNAISMTNIIGGVRADLRLLFYMGATVSSKLITVDDIEQVYMC